MPTDKDLTYREPGYDPSTFIPHAPLMPSGQPVPAAPKDPTANPGAAPRIDVGNGWGKDQK